MKLPNPGYQQKILKTLCWSRINDIPSTTASFYGVEIKRGSMTLHDFGAKPGAYGAQPITNMGKLRNAYQHLKISSTEVRKDKKLLCNAYRIELPIDQVKAIAEELK